MARIEGLIYPYKADIFIPYWPHRLMVRTAGFQSVNRSSTLRGVTMTRNIKIISYFVGGIVWLFSMIVALYGFAIAAIWIGDKISGHNSFIELSQPCTSRYCTINGVYAFFNNHLFLSVLAIIFAILGLIYINRTRNSKRLPR